MYTGPSRTSSDSWMNRRADVGSLTLKGKVVLKGCQPLPDTATTRRLRALPSSVMSSKIIG